MFRARAQTGHVRGRRIVGTFVRVPLLKQASVEAGAFRGELSRLARATEEVEFADTVRPVAPARGLSVALEDRGRAVRAG